MYNKVDTFKSETNQKSLKQKIEYFDKNALEQKQQLCKVSKPLLIISQILLSAPAFVHIHTNTYKRWQKAAYYGLQFIWGFFVYSCIVRCVSMEFEGWLDELLSPEKPLVISELGFVVIHAFLITISMSMGHEKFPQFINYIADFDHTLYIKLNLTLKYNDLKRFVGNHLRLLLLYIICTTVAVYVSKRYRWIPFLYSNTASMVPNLIINSSLIQYYALMYTIYKRMQILGGVLDHTLSNNSITKWENGSMQQQIRTIRQLFADLEEFTKQVNETFGRLLFILFLDSFTNVICANFWLYRKIAEDCEPTGCGWIAFYIIWDCMHISKILLVMYYNQGISNQKHKTAALLSSYNYDEALQPTFKRFILQMMSDTRLNVVCGLLTINMTLITSIFVSAASLFVFFVQYLETFKALTSNHNN